MRLQPHLLIVLFAAFLQAAALASAAVIDLQPAQASACVGDPVLFQGTLSNLRASSDLYTLQFQLPDSFTGYLTPSLQVPGGEQRDFQLVASPSCGTPQGLQTIAVTARSGQGDTATGSAQLQIRSCLALQLIAATATQSACTGQPAAYSLTVRNTGGRDYQVTLSADAPVTFSANAFTLAPHAQKTVQATLSATTPGSQKITVTASAAQGCETTTAQVALTLNANACNAVVPYATPAPGYYPAPAPTYYPTPTPAYYPTPTPASYPTPTPTPTTHPTSTPSPSPTPTATPAGTPYPTSCLYDWQCASGNCNVQLGECEPTASATPAPTPTPTISATATPSPTISPNPTESPSASPTPEANATPSPNANASAYALESLAPENVTGCDNATTFLWTVNNKGLADAVKFAAVDGTLQATVEPAFASLEENARQQVRVTARANQTGVFELKLFAESQATGLSARSTVLITLLPPQDPACPFAPITAVQIASAQVTTQGNATQANVFLKNIYGKAGTFRILPLAGWTSDKTELDLAGGQTAPVQFTGTKSTLEFDLADLQTGGRQHLSLQLSEFPGSGTSLFVLTLATVGPYVLLLVLFSIALYIVVRGKRRGEPPSRPVSVYIKEPAGPPQGKDANPENAPGAPKEGEAASGLSDQDQRVIGEFEKALDEKLTRDNGPADPENPDAALPPADDDDADVKE